MVIGLLVAVLVNFIGVVSMEVTLVLIIGGLLLAAIGVFMIIRARRTA